jgi:hypothetical protein
MAFRYYLLPKTTVAGPGGIGLTTQPAYLQAAGVTVWGAMDYGLEPVMLVRADVTSPQHNAIAANADADAFPANLENTVGSNLATVSAQLEAKGIPGDWVTAGMTFRAVLRWVARLFCIAQRLNGRARLRLLSEQTLDSTVGDLSAARRQALNDAAQSLGLDTSSITLAMTIRQALKILGNQITLPIVIGEAL